MGSEVRVTDPKTGGQKGRKPERYSLIPPNDLELFVTGARGTQAGSVVKQLADFLEHRELIALETAKMLLVGLLKACDVHPGDELARVYGMGAEKYAPFNWMKGYAWSLSFDSCCRHISLFCRGENRDDESKLHHLAHATWHVITLSTFYERALGTDDLYRDPDPIVPAHTPVEPVHAPIALAFCDACQGTCRFLSGAV